MLIKVTTGAIDSYTLGEVAEYPADLAEKLISLGLAEPVDELEPEPPAEQDDLEGKKLDELKELCRDLGLPTGGKKDELVARIREARAAEEPEGEEPGDDGLDDEEPPALSAEVPR